MADSFDDDKFIQASQQYETLSKQSVEVLRRIVQMAMIYLLKHLSSTRCFVTMPTS